MVIVKKLAFAKVNVDAVISLQPTNWDTISVTRSTWRNFGAHHQNRGIRGLIIFFPNEKMYTLLLQICRHVGFIMFHFRSRASATSVALSRPTLLGQTLFEGDGGGGRERERNALASYWTHISQENWDCKCNCHFTTWCCSEWCLLVYTPINSL